jgi:hypothetical protein
MTAANPPEAGLQLPGWAPQFIAAVSAAARGDAEMLAELHELLPRMEAAPDWRNLPPAARRIVAGERDPRALCAGLDDVDATIVLAILDELAVVEAGAEDDHPDAISLDQFLELVGQACRADAPNGLNEQLQGATLGMAQQAGGAPEINALGRILNGILCGDRQPDLSALPAPLAAKVQALLASL